MYTAMRRLPRLKKKTPLIVRTKGGGTTTDVDEQLEVVTSFFQNMFHSDNSKGTETVPPTATSSPFTKSVIRKAVTGFKNRKKSWMRCVWNTWNTVQTLSMKKTAHLLNQITETGVTEEDIAWHAGATTEIRENERASRQTETWYCYLFWEKYWRYAVYIISEGEYYGQRTGHGGETTELMTLQLMAEMQLHDHNTWHTSLWWTWARHLTEWRGILWSRIVLKNDELHLFKIL